MHSMLAQPGVLILGQVTGTKRSSWIRWPYLPAALVWVVVVWKESGLKGAIIRVVVHAACW
jgi:hypothetical protein